MRIMLCLMTSIGLFLWTLSPTASSSSAEELALECTVGQIGPSPGWISGDTVVYRLAKYRIRQVCVGDYKDDHIIVDHLVLTGLELNGINVGDRVCIAVRKAKEIPARYNAEGIREPSDDVKFFYIGERIEPSHTTLCACKI